MFPLSTVLLPGMVLPLHVFEPRYRALVADCLAEEPEFGVVLIDRGHEVGGGDVRRPIGTVARIVQVAAIADGRSAVVSVGTRRLRVTKWLEDDPYPRAEVEDWPDDPEGADGDATPGLDAVVSRLRRVLATYHAAGLAPLGEDDRYRLLAAPGPVTRLAMLHELLAGAEELLRFRVIGG